MTDNEIIKALECCQTGQDCYKCEYQPSKQDRKGTVGCSLQLISNALDLINRQQAEIESLQKLCDSRNFVLNGVLDKLIDDGIKQEEHLTTMSNNMIKTIETAKTIAIKEFADLVSAEINRALTNNHKVKQERISKLIEQGVAYNDEFCNYCDGKIHALCGIGDFIQNLVKEMVGEE